MNKHGQTLVLFVIIIPLLLLLGAVVVDLGIVVNSKIRTTEITKTAIKESDDESTIKEILIKNEVDTTNLEVIVDENLITVKNKYNVSSVFGAIIGIKNYAIKIEVSESKE